MSNSGSTINLKGQTGVVKKTIEGPRKILIIAAHFPPSNLAGVHRSRLFGQHLPSFGWEPIILTVDEKYYEEELDWNIAKLVPEGLRVEKANAFKLTRPRTVGDLGLRAFFQMSSKAVELVKNEKIDFLYITIPSFYMALVGRYVHWKTGVPYGIDYIDPWVHWFPGTHKKFSRHWWSTKLAKFLEPIAVKKASLITGVAEGYYSEVIKRNPHLKKSTVFGAMPYGGEKQDHLKVRELQLKPYLFEKREDKLQLVYAGAMLPLARPVADSIFQAISENPERFKNVEFHFIGTGKIVYDPESYNIKPIAEKWGLWKKQVFEYAKRIPYLDALIHLEASSGIFILGSTQAHYTPSKVYQSVLSRKPILAVLHSASTAVQVINESCAGVVLDFNGENELEKVRKGFAGKFEEYSAMLESWNPSDVKHDMLDQYSAKNVTQQLAELLDRASKTAPVQISTQS
jgi:hypothetical protein